MVVVIYFILYNNNIIIIILPHCSSILLHLIVVVHHYYYIIFLLCAETGRHHTNRYIEPLLPFYSKIRKTHNGRNAAFHHCMSVVSHEYWRSIYFCGFVFLSVMSKLAALPRSGRVQVVQKRSSSTYSK